MQQQIKNEQSRLLFAGLPSALLATLVLLALTVTLSELTGTFRVINACLVIFIVTALRWLLWVAHRRQLLVNDDIWSRLFLAGSIAAGTAWGAAALIVFPQHDIAAQTFLSFIISGVSAGAVTSLAVDRRNMLGFVLPCVLPLSVRLYADPSAYTDTMAVMVLVYTGVIIAAGLRLHGQILENIVLRLEASERQSTLQRSQYALAAANRHLREVIDAADHVAIIAADMNGAITMINRGAEKLLGYSESELCGKLTLEQLLDAEEVRNIADGLSTPERTLSGLDALLQHTRASGSYSRQCVLIGKQAQHMHVDLVLTATRGADDGINGFLATAMDVGERKRASEELQRLNERFKLATDSSGMGIWDWDAATDKLVWDDRAYEIYSVPRDISPNLTYLLGIVHPDDVQQVRAEFFAAWKGERKQLLTSHRIICSSGEERFISVSALIRRNSSGRVVRMTGLIWDSTENQRVERMKNEFVATVSHELRTPLTSIRGSLGLVAAGVAGKLPERASGLVNMALNNCERLTLLINDILDMEKLESDRQRFDVRHMEVAELVVRSLEDNAGFAHSFGVHFTTPEPLSRAQVLVDPDRFLQVMANLLSNASKFSPAGAAIEVTARSERGDVRIAVRDHGLGIPPDFQPRVFQKFSQADSSDSRSLAGTGLGLAISRAIAERLGGHISFDTGAGGTTFFFDLPAAHGSAAQTPAATQSKVT